MGAETYMHRFSFVHKYGLGDTYRTQQVNQQHSRVP